MIQKDLLKMPLNWSHTEPGVKSVVSQIKYLEFRNAALMGMPTVAASLLSSVICYFPESNLLTLVRLRRIHM